MLLKNCRFVVADSGRILENANIFIEKGKIISVSGKGSLPKGSKSGKVIDCKNKIAIPSFANMHTHTPKA